MGNRGSVVKASLNDELHATLGALGTQKWRKKGLTKNPSGPKIYRPYLFCCCHYYHSASFHPKSIEDDVLYLLLMDLNYFNEFVYILLSIYIYILYI